MRGAANLGQVRRDRRYHVIIPATIVGSYYLCSSKAFINNNHIAVTTIQLIEASSKFKPNNPQSDRSGRLKRPNLGRSGSRPSRNRESESITLSSSSPPPRHGLSFLSLSSLPHLLHRPPFDGHSYSAPIIPEQCLFSSDPDGIRRHERGRLQLQLYRQRSLTTPPIFPPCATGF